MMTYVIYSLYGDCIICPWCLTPSKANAPTQAQTEIKARNVQVFGKVLRKRYPELKVEAVDISADLYATDLRHLPLEITFNHVCGFNLYL